MGARPLRRRVHAATNSSRWRTAYDTTAPAGVRTLIGRASRAYPWGQDERVSGPPALFAQSVVQTLPRRPQPDAMAASFGQVSDVARRLKGSALAAARTQA